MAFEPIAAAVKLGCSALAGDLHLRARIAAEFGALTCSGHFELRNRIHADAISKLLVYAGVRNGLSIYREIVLSRALPVKRGCAGNSISRCTGYGLEEPREITAIERDIQNLSSRNDAGTFGRYRFELHRFGFDSYGLALRANFQNNRRQSHL